MVVGEVPRSTDNLPQFFWFDDSGRPEAAVIVTDWRGWIGLDPIVMPDATPIGLHMSSSADLLTPASPGLKPSNSRSTVPMT